MDELDIIRLARRYVDDHGPDAPIQASQQADDLLDIGDVSGAERWDQVMRAAERLLAEESAFDWGDEAGDGLALGAIPPAPQRPVRPAG